MVKLMAEVKVIRRWSRRAGPQVAATVSQDSQNLPGTFHRPQSRRDCLSVGCEAILIGASTGGPLPIRTILSALPSEFPAAVLVVQHIASGFGAGFAEWLASASHLPVHIPRDGELVAPGHVYVAPDEAHLGLREGPRIRLGDGEPENGLRPSVSHLFRSAGKIYGKRAIGILLSGMGKDGAEELKELRRHWRHNFRAGPGILCGIRNARRGSQIGRGAVHNAARGYRRGPSELGDNGRLERGDKGVIADTTR